MNDPLERISHFLSFLLVTPGHRTRPSVVQYLANLREEDPDATWTILAPMNEVLQDSPWLAKKGRDFLEVFQYHVLAYRTKRSTASLRSMKSLATMDAKGKRIPTKGLQFYAPVDFVAGHPLEHIRFVPVKRVLLPPDARKKDTLRTKK